LNGETRRSNHDACDSGHTLKQPLKHLCLTLPRVLEGDSHRAVGFARSAGSDAGEAHNATGFEDHTLSFKRQRGTEIRD